MSTATGSEWELARRWLLDAKVIPANHPVNSPSAELIDFANCLRDGVFLCALLNKLVPNSVAHYHPRASLQFKCVQNINAFLMSCHRDFGVQQHDLFQAADLYDVSDFAQVVRCLSALSHTSPAVASGLESFPDVGHGGASREEEDIYGNLENIASSTKASGTSTGAAAVGQRDEFGYTQESIYDSVLEAATPAEDIYGSVVTYQKKECLPQQGSGFAGLPEKLGYVVAELIETEKSYVEVLSMLTEHYIGPLKNRLDGETQRTVFINLAELLDVHTRFNAALQRELDAGALNLSQCFLSHADDFVNYGTYCARLPASQLKVQELMDKPDTSKMLDTCKKASKQRFALKELLSVPMQRVLKYPLLLRELIKTGKKCDYADIPGLEKAQEAIQDVAKCVNEIKRDIESVHTMKEIQNSITDYKGEDLICYGRSLVDGEVRFKTFEEPKPKLRYAFLFDKALMICKSKGEKFSFKMLFKLDEYRMEDIAQSSGAKGKFSYAIQVQGLSSATALNSSQIYTKTQQIKTEWMGALQKAVQNLNHPNKNSCGHNLELVTIDRPTARCSVCHRLMWGLILQGYVCSVCDGAVHSDCMTNQSSACQGQAPNPGGRNSTTTSVVSGRSVPPIPPSSRPQPRAGANVNSPASKAPAGGGGGSIVLAIRSYTGVPPPPANKSALHFNIGEDIEVSSTTGDWWEGRSLNSGNTGVFLAAFVKPKTDISNAERKRRAARGSYEESKIPPRLPGVPGVPPSARSMPSPANRRKMYEAYPWFVGIMSRADAELSMLYTQDGVFLIRESEARPGEFALTLRYRNQAKHIKIIIRDEQYYISQAKVLSSMVGLVEHYMVNTLETSFPELTTTLQTPFRHTTGKCIAQYDFAARDHEELSIEEDMEIKILSKESPKYDWWYGTARGVFGLFPSNYVEEF